MSNILYLGPYREFSGLGNASRNYIKALILSGHNVSIRPIYNTFKCYPEFDIDNDILELENNFQKKYHTVIQHCFPHQYYLDSRFDKTIGIAQLESKNYNSILDDYFNIPDELIVPSNYVYNIVKESGKVNKTVHTIPIPIDIEEITSYQNNKIQNETNKYNFYAIADFVNKNNILQILEAFLLAFDEDDGVDIVIKTKNKTQEHSDLHQVIEYELSQLSNRIGKHHQKPKIIIGETKKESILYLHHNNNCYIDLSSGKSFGYSALEALVFNNSVLCLKHSAQSEITENTGNLLVDSSLVYCRDDSRMYDFYNTVNQKWLVPSIEDLILKLKLVHTEDIEHQKERLQKTNLKIQKYTIENISEQFKYL